KVVRSAFIGRSPEDGNSSGATRRIVIRRCGNREDELGNRLVTNQFTLKWNVDQSPLSRRSSLRQRRRIPAPVLPCFVETGPDLVTVLVEAGMVDTWQPGLK